METLLDEHGGCGTDDLVGECPVRRIITDALLLGEDAPSVVRVPVISVTVPDSARQLAPVSDARRRTPDVPKPGGGVIIAVRRCCNGCGQPIGDVTEDEIDAAVGGLPLPDVRHECPRCAPTLEAR